MVFDATVNPASRALPSPGKLNVEAPVSEYGRGASDGLASERSGRRKRAALG